MLSISVISWKIYNEGAKYVGLMCFRRSEQESKKTSITTDKGV
jgi:hypothetical protein